MFLFGLVAWGYVAAIQLRDVDTVYKPLAVWVPIRLDCFGEAAFVLSMVAYFLLKFWETKKWQARASRKSFIFMKQNSDSDLIRIIDEHARYMKETNREIWNL
jgi:hypothetical protein